VASKVLLEVLDGIFSERLKKFKKVDKIKKSKHVNDVTEIK